jgi:hypothetical protein
MYTIIAIIIILMFYIISSEKMVCDKCHYHVIADKSL